MITSSRWRIAKVEEVISRISNGTSLSQSNEKTDYPVSRIETISDGSVSFDRVKYVTPSEKDVEKFQVKINDILFSNINSDIHLGKTAIYKNSRLLLHGINTLLIRVNERVDADFFNYYCHYLRSAGTFINIASHAVNQSSINQTKIKNLKIPLPEISEQEAIVAKIEELFSEIDNTETNLQRSSGLLKGYWSAAFEQLYKDGGEAVLLSDCIELSQNGLAKRNSKSGVEYKVLRLADIKNKSITHEAARYIKLENKEIEKYKLIAGDLVAIRVNGSRELVGNLIHYPKDDEWAYCDHFIRLRVKEGVLHPLYLKYYFETQFVKNYLKQKMVSTAGQNTISQGSLLSLSIPIVPLEKQTEIVMKAKEIEGELLSLNKQITTLLKQCKTNKQTILLKAFKGELV